MPLLFVVVWFMGLVASTATTLAGQPSQTDSQVAAFKEAYANLKSVSLKFSSSYGSGTLTAVRGKGFRIVTSDREIVSNGSTVWNVQKSSKMVVINSVEGASDELSIEQIFFALMNVYTPSVLKSGKSSTIRLKPPSPSMQISGVEQADVVLGSNMSINRIIVTTQGTVMTLEIRNLKRDPKINLNTFVYNVPKGWKTVDLR